MDTIHRFIFEQLDIRGSLVRLGPAWRAMHANRDYPVPARNLLGELAAVTTIIGSNLKTPGRARFQLQGNGPVSLLVMDCDEQLRLRGMARSALQAAGEDAGAVVPAPSFTARDLLGDGQLVLTLQTANAAPWQSVVPRQGESVAEIFEHYLTQSEQQPARLWLAASAETACGLFLQKLPEADGRDADGWNRITQLAATVRPDELALPPETLLTRLFAEEDIRLFEPRHITWHCPRDEEKIRNLLLTMGRTEVEEILGDAQAIAIADEICGHEYHFGPEILDELFPPAGRLLH
ncbi:MAG: Hsp33 family molecular chaperone HslO [Rhodocyclales bacterium]|nr:Hsp33 family molecular chaperone HslO [Rhodocyclales bacterium]